MGVGVAVGGGVAVWVGVGVIEGDGVKVGVQLGQGVGDGVGSVAVGSGEESETGGANGVTVGVAVSGAVPQPTNRAPMTVRATVTSL